MKKKEHDELSLPIATVRILLSMAIMATGYLMVVAFVGQIDNMERLFAAGFLTIAFRQILMLVFLIQLSFTFTSTPPHELEHKRDR